jgi:hypothetical protein
MGVIGLSLSASSLYQNEKKCLLLLYEGGLWAEIAREQVIDSNLVLPYFFLSFIVDCCRLLLLIIRYIRLW